MEKKMIKGLLFMFFFQHSLLILSSSALKTRTLSSGNCLLLYAGLCSSGLYLSSLCGSDVSPLSGIDLSGFVLDLMQATTHRNSTNEDTDNGSGTKLKGSIKNEHRFGGGSHSHGGGGSSGYGNNNGGSRSPKTQGGGSNFIPVYAAGAANNRHTRHHGAGNRNLNNIGFFALVANSMASLVTFFV